MPLPCEFKNIFANIRSLMRRCFKKFDDEFCSEAESIKARNLMVIVKEWMKCNVDYGFIVTRDDVSCYLNTFFPFVHWEIVCDLNMLTFIIWRSIKECVENQVDAKPEKNYGNVSKWIIDLSSDLFQILQRSIDLVYGKKAEKKRKLDESNLCSTTFKSYLLPSKLVKFDHHSNTNHHQRTYDLENKVMMTDDKKYSASSSKNIDHKSRDGDLKYPEKESLTNES